MPIFSQQTVREYLYPLVFYNQRMWLTNRLGLPRGSVEVRLSDDLPPRSSCDDHQVTVVFQGASVDDSSSNLVSEDVYGPWCRWYLSGFVFHPSSILFTLPFTCLRLSASHDSWCIGEGPRMSSLMASCMEELLRGTVQRHAQFLYVWQTWESRAANNHLWCGIYLLFVYVCVCFHILPMDNRRG